LPYELHTHARVNAGTATLTLIFGAAGGAGAVFHVYDKKHLDRIPRRYTVEAGKELADDWSVAADDGRYDLAVYGPNGYFRHFKGTVAFAAQPEIRVAYEPSSCALRLKIDNPGSRKITVVVADSAYGSGGPWLLAVGPGRSTERVWSLQRSGRWYDFKATLPGSPDYERRIAGRVENGMHGHSDPATAIL
jgi:phospholipase C